MFICIFVLISSHTSYKNDLFLQQAIYLYDWQQMCKHAFVFLRKEITLSYFWCDKMNRMLLLYCYFIHNILYVQRIKWFKINHFQLIPTVMILQCKICWKLSQDVIHFPRKQIDIVIELRVCQTLPCYF